MEKQNGIESLEKDSDVYKMLMYHKYELLNNETKADYYYLVLG